MFVKTTDDECETASFPVNIELDRSNMSPVAQISIFSYVAIMMMTSLHSSHSDQNAPFGLTPTDTIVQRSRSRLSPGYVLLY